MIWHEHVDCNSYWEKARISIQSQEVLLTIQLLTLYKAQIRPSLEYFSHIWGAAAPTTCLYLMQSREGQFDSSVTRP
nr:unnamed protein product [Callosobruchus chinensis]